MKQKFYFPHLHENEKNVKGSPVCLSIDSSSNYDAPGDCLGYFTLGPTMNMECTIWKDNSPIKKLKVNARVAPVDVYSDIWEKAKDRYDWDDDYRKEVNEKVMEEYSDNLQGYDVNDNIYDAIDYENYEAVCDKFNEIFNSYMTEAEFYQYIYDNSDDYDCSRYFTTTFAKFIEDCINGSDEYKDDYCYTNSQLYGKVYCGDIMSVKNVA